MLKKERERERERTQRQTHYKLVIKLEIKENEENVLSSQVYWKELTVLRPCPYPRIHTGVVKAEREVCLGAWIMGGAGTGTGLGLLADVHSVPEPVKL